MIDHITLMVSDITRSKAFYQAALEPLGYGVIMALPTGAGLGVAGKPDLWIFQMGEAPQPVHVAFAASDRAAVHAFHAAALAAGATDNGGPGLRAQYHPNYYGAFVHDPDGHNIEAVCHAPG